MSLPIFKDKYGKQAIILPDHFGENRKKYKGKIPTKCIFLYQDEPYNYLKQKFKGKYKELKVDFLWLAKIHYTKDFLFVKIDAVGATHAVWLLEELILLGVKEFINVGIAGGLKTAGNFLCIRAIRDEGTSIHYVPHRKYTYPDKTLTKKFKKCLEKRKINFSESTNWTIGAPPFRETIAEVEYYKKHGVSTVDLETSALFTVAKLKKVKIAAAFTVSDILKEDWENLYADKPEIVKRNLINLVKAAIDCFSK